MIDTDLLFHSLDDVESHLRRLGRRVVDLLQPGLSESDVVAREATLPFSFTRELAAIYQWRNGTLAQAGDVLDELNFFPGFYFLSLEEAIETFHERKSAPQWRKGWFPFFADGAGDFYIAPCTRRVVDTSQVIGFIHGEPEQIPEYQSITTMIQTLGAAFAADAIYLDRDNTLELDDGRYAAIARRFNPEIPEWQG